MAIPSNRIIVTSGRGWNETAVSYTNGDVVNPQYASLYGIIAFDDKVRTGTQYQTMKTAYDGGTPVFFQDGASAWPYSTYAFDSNDEDSAGSPVIYPIEDWMWEYYPFHTDGQRALDKLGEVSPGLTPTIVVPSTNVVAGTATVDGASRSTIICTPFAPWYILRNGQSIRISHVRLIPSLGRMDVVQTDGGSVLDGYDVRATQTWMQGQSVTTSATEKGNLNATNTTVATITLLTNFAAGRDTTLYIAPATFSGIEAEGSGSTSGIVGTVACVYTGTTAPTGPPSGVTWSTQNNDLMNIPQNWQKLADYDPATDLGSGESPWISFAFVGSTGNLGAFSDPVYAGNSSVEYSVDGETNWHTTKATADLYYRFYDNGTWSPALAIHPKATLDWKVLATIDRTSTGASANFATYKWITNTMDLTDISELMFRRTTTAGTHNGMRRISKPVPVEDFLQSAQHYSAIGSGTNFSGQRMLVGLGWFSGKITDVFPLHANYSFGNESNPGIDSAFFVTLFREQGAATSSRRIQAVEINKMTGGHVNCKIEILGR